MLCFGHQSLGFFLFLLHNSSQSFYLSINSGRAHIRMGKLVRVGGASVKTLKVKGVKILPEILIPRIRWHIQTLKKDRLCGDERWNKCLLQHENTDATLQCRPSERRKQSILGTFKRSPSLKCFWNNLCIYSFLKHLFKQHFGTRILSKVPVWHRHWIKSKYYALCHTKHRFVV